MEEQHHWLADDAGEQTDRTVNALTAHLEVFKAALLECAETIVCFVYVSKIRKDERGVGLPFAANNE